MLALGVLLLIPVVMWSAQNIHLRVHGLPWRWRLGGSDLPHGVKRAGRVITNISFAAALVAYPLLRGELPWSYYAAFMPLNGALGPLMHGVASATLYLALLYLVWTLTGNTDFAVRHPPGRVVRRLAGVPLTAVSASFLEELLFRAMLLAELLETFDAVLAVAIGTFVFAGAHYVRSVKRRWTFPGHVALGLLLCVAFVVTRSIWLSLGLHAGGVLMLMGVRPFVRYRGPAWLVGASIFPYAGIVGVLALGLLTVNVWLAYGGGR
jgi:membrane protease YdiL (CAAX protease family)